ncbi:MAG: hypothetical protein ACJA2S_001438 [Cyclobacteriaceae bacterium]
MSRLELELTWYKSYKRNKMGKKILIGFGVFVTIVIAFLLYANNRNRTLSPSGHTEMENNSLKVSVDYSRPSVRKRLIFGTEAEGALQPHGKYWRLGANEPTLLTVNKDFKLNGIAAKAGSYDIYAIPSADGFEIRLNQDGRFWGYTEPDYSLDVIKTNVSSTKTGTSVEQFTIKSKAGKEGVNLIFAWANKQWEIMITGQ